MTRRLPRALLAVLLLACSFPGSAFAAASSSLSVSFVDANTGFTSGTRTDGQGFVARTTDGGTNWSATLLAGAGFRLHAYSTTSAWAVSPFSTTPFRYMTSATSSSWVAARNIPQPVGGGAQVLDVVQAGLNSAVAVGRQYNAVHGTFAAIWKTSDGGLSWSVVQEGPSYPYDDVSGTWPQTLAEYRSVGSDPSGLAIMAVGGEALATTGTPPVALESRGLIASSTDGGYTWATQSLETSGTPIEDVSLPLTGEAWAIAGRRVFRTTDAGATWADAAGQTSTELAADGYAIDANAVAATSAASAIVAGSTFGTSTVAAVARTIDGGANWRVYRDTSSPAVTLRDVTIVSPTRAVAVGDNNVMLYLRLNDDGTMVLEKRIVATNGEYPTKPAPTLSFGAPATSNYASAKLSGYLKNAAGKPIPGRRISIQRLGATDWEPLGIAMTNSSGYYSYTAAPTSKATFRAVFSEDDTYLGRTSASRSVLPRAFLSQPRGPVKTKRNLAFTSYGLLQPRHRSGTYPVKLHLFRYVNGRWRYHKTLRAKASDYGQDTKYWARVSLPYAGRWRIQAYHADSGHAATYSTPRFITVQ